jgi:ATP-dependent exoDNAse (exonuclease V) alpha subunit
MTQQQVLDVLKLGHNVFLTGEPGSGKTYTLNQFIDYLHSHDIEVGITASTGIAATHINGMTIHSWSGIGIDDDMSDRDIDKLVSSSSYKNRFKFTRVLIIDEISMLNGARLELINRVLKRSRSSDKPFGGIQLVLCGDLFQLPPITKDRNEPDFPHRSATWRELGLQICYLAEQHRAEDDTLLSLLRSIRSNDDHQSVYDILGPRVDQVKDINSDITRLFTHNKNVDKLNNERLKQLSSGTKQFMMRSEGQQQYIDSLVKGCQAPEQLELKIGAQVICVTNSPANGYVNGSRGEVVEFDDADGSPIIKLHSGRRITMERHEWTVDDGDKTLAKITQYPLRLAWAITVHKSQGMSLDEAEVDLSKAFAPGMGYVALSRVTHLDGLYLRGINNQALIVSPDVAMFDPQLRELSQIVLDSLLGIDDKKLKNMQKRVRDNLSQPYASYDKNMYKRLKAWRSEQASADSKPAYTVLGDKTLIALSAEKPTSRSALKNIYGIGPAKIDSYGDELLKIINNSLF